MTTRDEVMERAVKALDHALEHANKQSDSAACAGIAEGYAALYDRMAGVRNQTGRFLDNTRRFNGKAIII